MESGNQFVKMIISGTNNLYNHKELIDTLNVFPVPDGDTGKNMYLTMSGAAFEASKLENLPLSDVVERIATATLKSARGNSGVILSQLFRGISKALKDVNVLNGESLSISFTHGSQTAYKSVMKPTEGTILTVARESAAAATEAAKKNNDLLYVFNTMVSAAKISLENTPNLLPMLKDAGVVDSGGMGWLCILEGMLYFLENGTTVEKIDNEPCILVETPIIDNDIDITYTYCTEFIIEKTDATANSLYFKRFIEKLGDSVVLVDDFNIIKVHIHTENPGSILDAALKLGMLCDIKIDNMRKQSEIKANSEEIPKKPYGIVAVSSGDGFADIMRELGVNHIIEGGQTMNPSTGDILDAINSVNAEIVYVFPNNKNIILAAEQAKKLSNTKVEVLPSKSVPQGIAAIIAFDTLATPEQNLKAMKAEMNTIKTGLVTYAIRDSRIKGHKILEGDIIGLLDKTISICGSTPLDVACKLCQKMVRDNHAVLSVYYGKDISDAESQKIQSILKDLFPDLDVIVQYGGQPIYYYIVSVE